MTQIRAACTIAGLLFAASAGSWLAFATQATAADRAFTREPNTDRSGNDIRRDVLPADATVEMCEARCQALKDCVSFTFVKRSTTVPQPICWLKDAAPFGYDSSCCTSGTVKK